MIYKLKEWVSIYSEYILKNNLPEELSNANNIQDKLYWDVLSDNHNAK